MANNMKVEIVGKFRDLISPKLKNIRAQMTAIQAQSRRMGSALGGSAVGARAANDAMGGLGATAAAAAVGAGVMTAGLTRTVAASAAAADGMRGLTGYVTDLTRGLKAGVVTHLANVANSMIHIERNGRGFDLFSKRVTASLYNIRDGALTAVHALDRFAMKGLGALAAVAGAAGIAIVNVARKFEVMKVTLANMFPKGNQAEQAFAFILDLAKQLPSTLDEVTSAFIKLRSLGLTPTKDAIVAYSNIAAAMGKPLIQMVEAVGDATTGEFERLKEFGIKAKTIGDDVQFTFKGIKSNLIKKDDVAGIEAYLQGLAQLDGVGGAATAQMLTLNGEISNLGVEFSQFATEFAEDTGMLGGLSKFVRYIADAIGGWDDLMLSMRLGLTAIVRAFAVVGSNIYFGVRKLALQVGFAFEQMSVFVENAFVSVANAVISTINDTVTGVLNGINSLVSQVNKIPGVNLSKLDTGSAVTPFKGATADLEDYQYSLQQLAAEEAGYRAQVDGVADAFVDIAIAKRKSTQESREGAEAFNDFLKKDAADTQRKKKAIDDAAAAAERMRSALEPVLDMFRNTFSSFFTDIVYDSQNAFKNLADNFSRAITRMVSDALAADLVKSLFGTSGSGGAMGGGLQSVFMSMFGAREHGGPVTAGSPYIVGEKRPEIFVPNSNGTIVPNTNGLGGGSTNVTINAIDAQGVAAFIETNKFALAGAVKNTTQRYNMR